MGGEAVFAVAGAPAAAYGVFAPSGIPAMPVAGLLVHRV